MNEIDPVAALLTASVKPELSDYYLAREAEKLQQPPAVDTRLAYRTYDNDVEVADEIYDPTDFRTVGRLIRDNVASAITARFPVIGDTHTLAIENVRYEKPKNTSLKEESDALKHGKSVADRLKGDWVLYDNATGKEIQRKSATLLNVPRMTERGTFIRNGSEQGLKHMFRLRPGVYARVKGDGHPAVHFNPAQLTGQQMSFDLDPETGIMIAKRGTRTYGVLPLLLASGVPEEAIRASWGDKLYEMNFAKYGKMINPENKVFQEYQALYKDHISPMKLDEETTLSTMGAPFATVTPEALLTASNKVLKLSRSMSADDEDDRDSLAYQRVMGPADYIPERIVRDGGGLLRKLFQRVTREGKLDSIESGAFQPHVDSVFLEDKHASYIDGASPFEALDLNSMVSRIGEGGIGDIKAAPAETRGVNDSYLGFIDPVRCYTPDTEILTTAGWVFAKDLKMDMEVACLVDGLLVYNKPEAINVYEYSGDMISYDSSALSFCVTPNHRMYTTALLDDEEDYHIVLACNMYEDRELQYFVTGKHFHNTQMHLNPGNFTKAPYEGKVYCPTVPGGLVYVRRHNKAGFWCGNSPESLKVGLDVYMSYGVRKDSKGRLYGNFRDKTGEAGYRPMDTIARSIVATPEFWDPNADPEEYIPAFNKGKQIDYVKRKDVDFFLTSSNNMMSIGAGTIPNIGGIRSNRTLMGCLHPSTELLVKVGASIPMHITAEDALNLYNDGVSVEIPVMTENKTSYRWKEVRQVLLIPTKVLNTIVFDDGNRVTVTTDHKWLVKDEHQNYVLKSTSDINHAVDMFPKATINGGIKWVCSIGAESCDTTDYLVDIDVDDNVYMLANGLFTHNSKYPLQALSLEKREAPLVQRRMEIDGVETTTEKVIAKQLGAKFSPADGKVVSVSADEIVIRDRDGQKHTIELYNNYPANQKGFLTNTPLVQEGQRVHANDILAKSNYTTDTGEAALGVNLRTAFVPAKGSANFEDAIVISESAAKKLASEQMHKFRGDLSSDTEYGKKKYLSLFGAGEYTKEQLDKIGDDGMPQPGTVFQKGDPVFLGTQIRDLSTSGLSRRASVPYVKIWEHEEPGTVIDVTQGKKHMTIYTKSYTPMRPGDKMCFDDQTEVLTDSGWKFFKDILMDDKVLTIDYHTGESKFADYSDAYSYEVVDEKMYTLKTKRLDICTTKEHRHLVSCMNNSSYLTLKTSDEIFGKRIYHLVGLDLDSRYNFAGSKDDNPKERWKKYTGKVYCITVPDTHTMYVRRNGKAVWSGNSSRYGAKGVVSCYDSSTYVFTDKGFKPFPELTIEDKVAYLDPVTNIARFTNPSEVQHAPYKGVMYGFDGKYLDWLVTPTHDMWVRRYFECVRHPEDQLFHRENVQNVHDAQWQHRVSATFESNQNCPTRFVLPEVEHRANAKNTAREFDIIDFAAFLGIWLAEGHLNYSEDFQQRHFVVITQKRDTKIPATMERCDKIEALLNRMGIIWSRQGIKYLISHKALCVYLSQFGYAKDKFIPEYVFTEWSREAQEVFVEWLYMGDGDKTGTNDLRYNTCSTKLRDGLQRLCTLLGKHSKTVTMREPGIDQRGTNHDYLFRVSISDREFANSRNSKCKVKAKGYYLQDYNGTIHCCTVPTGIIYVMRNGKPMWCGNSVRPDDQMPTDSQGRRMDILMTPLSLPSRLNTAMLGELQLSKIAEARGQAYTMPDFITDDTIDGFVSKELKKYGIPEKEDLYDPVTGKTIPQVSTGLLYNYKLKHMAELKERGRGTGVYTSEDVPMKGEGAARRLGMMEVSAVYSGGGMDVLRDAKLIRGQRNDDFWHDYKEGLTPQMPTTPLVHKKFISYLRGAGATIKRNGDLIHMYAATDNDMKELTGNRKVTSASTFDSKNMHPVDGGLFDPKIFGADGDQWGYVDLPEPVLNPLMFKPIASIMGWTDTELKEYLQGSRHTKGDFGTIPLMEQLKSVDLKSELKKAKDVLKAEGRTTIAQRDLARKRIRAIEPMLREGKHPTDFFFTRMPILPPKYRTVTTIGDETNVAADANFLYKRMMDASDDLKAAKDNLPEEYQVDARESLYNAVNAVVGTMPTDDPKLEAKGVGGLLKWAFGKGSPKCHDSETEILTENGWVPFPQYLDNSVAVGTMNPVTGMFEWQHPTDIIHEPYCGPMVYTKNNRLDCMVTPNHDYYGAFRQGRGVNTRWAAPVKFKAEELLKYTRRVRLQISTNGYLGNIPNCEEFWGEDTTAFAEFVGWYLADGYVHQDGYSVVFDVKAGGKKDKQLADLLMCRPDIRAVRAEYKRPPRDTGLVKNNEEHSIARFSVHSTELASWIKSNAGCGAATKKLSREVLEWDSEHLRYLWTGYHKGDGHKKLTEKQQNGKTWMNRDPISNVGNSISTISKHLVDDFEEIGAKIGCQIVRSDYIDDGHGHENNPVYRITLHGFNYTVLEYPRQHEEVYYDGVVHCVTVPNGLVVTRRNHKVVVSGNSSSAHRKIFGANLDMGGLGTITPDGDLSIDEVGIPEESAWKMFEPFVLRDLRQSGFSSLNAMREVMERTPEARRALERQMEKRPILINRAPTLWRYGIQGQYAKIVKDNSIHVNPNICKTMNADFDGNCLDFDSKIIVKFSKSALDFFERNDYINSSVKPDNNKEENMGVTVNSVVAAKDVAEGLQLMSIGEFPRIGDSYKDKNGADVYGVPHGVEILTTDPVTGESKWCQVSQLTEEFECETSEILVGGRSVIASTNPTMAVFDPKEGKLVKVAADAHNGRLVPLFKKLPLPMGSRYDRDFGWWIGALVSDGWISGNIVGYTKLEKCKRDEFLRISRSICENFVCNEYAAKAGSGKLGDSVKLHLYGKEFADICKGFDIYSEVTEDTDGKKSSLRKQIPMDMLLNGSEEFLYGLLSGLLDGDGSLVKNMTTGKPRFNAKFCTSSKTLRESVEFVLYRLGIRYSTTVTPPRNWSNEAYNICFSTVDMYPVLDKLTCLGDREVGIISEWKDNPPAKDDTDLIPVSEAELAALVKAGLHKLDASVYTALNRGRRCSRSSALKIREFAREIAPDFVKRAENTNTFWAPIKSIKPAGKRTVYDVTVPDTKVFSANNGITVYDSMSTHVPVSNEAIEAIKENMLPSKNLISPQTGKAHFVPRDGANTGLYLASRMGKGTPVRFRTEEEAEEAYRKGLIKIDTPIEID